MTKKTTKNQKYNTELYDKLYGELCVKAEVCTDKAAAAEKSGGEENVNVYAVLMAGGVGSRFWPLSRRALPKQFLDLPACNFDLSNSMVKQTAERILPLVPPQNIVVATGSCYMGLAADALPWLPSENLVAETENLDTAFGMAGALCRIAQLQAARSGACGGKNGFGEVKVIFLPCDHYVEPTEIFGGDLRRALALAERNALVTLGIKPTEPLSEYGYIIGEEKEKETDGRSGRWFYGRRFVEKPHRKQAAELLKSQNVFWNSGIYIGKAAVFADTLYKSLFAEKERNGVFLTDEEKIRLVREHLLSRRQKISFDKLVMEKGAADFLVAAANFRWDDLGTFGALAKYWRAQDGNRVHGCRLAAHGSVGNIVFREGGLAVLVGVDDLLVAEADGVLLIMPKEKSRRLKKTVELLRKSDLQEYL